MHFTVNISSLGVIITRKIGTSIVPEELFKSITNKNVDLGINYCFLENA